MLNLLDTYPLPRINEKGSEIAKYSVYSTLNLRSTYHQVVIKPEDRPYIAFKVNGRLFQFWRLPFRVTNGVASFHRIIDRIISIEKLEGTFAYIDNVRVYGLNHSNHNSILKRFMAAVKHNLTLNNDKCSFCVNTINLIGYTVSKCSMTLDPEQLNPYWSCHFCLICVPFDKLWTCLPITLNGSRPSQIRYAHWYKRIFFPCYPRQLRFSKISKRI